MDRRLFISTLGALVAAGAATAGHAQDAAAAPAAPAAFEPGDYVLGAGDKLRLIVFGEDALGGEFVVGGNGRVSLPLVGELPAAGMTVRDFQLAYEGKLRDGYLRDPRVSAEVLNFRPFYILGEVNKPGEYPYTNGLTVLNAIATAGGFTYRARTNKVFIRRANEAAEHAYGLSSVLTVGPGDTIRIAERFL